jgi:seryl-tRNA synthetase
MKNIVRTTTISAILITILFGIVDCSPSISQEEYDRVKNELNDVETQVTALQGKLDEAMTTELQYDQLDVQYQELKNQYNAQIDEIQNIKSDFDELTIRYDANIDEIHVLYVEYDQLDQEYEELKRQYDAITQKNPVFSEEEIDQAIFGLINQERSDIGLDELIWGENLYWWARQNSSAMSKTGDFKYSDWLSVQAVLITAGQETFDGLVNGVMDVWKQRKHEYSPKILSTSVLYGAVATVKSGDVYYITYVASTSP